MEMEHLLHIVVLAFVQEEFVRGEGEAVGVVLDAMVTGESPPLEEGQSML